MDLVVEISSDEEDRCGDHDHDDDLIILERSPQRRPRKPRKIEAPEMETGMEDDFECCIVSSSKAEHKALETVDEAGDELIVTGEVGPVACRDFPHARHLCVRFPFGTSRHFDCCEQCHCYVCDTLAPCKYWSQHCDASDREDRWLTMRKYKIVQLPLSWTTNPPTRPKTRPPLIQTRRPTLTAPAPRSTVAPLRSPATSSVSKATVPRGAVPQTPPASVGAMRPPAPSPAGGAVRPPPSSPVGGAVRPPTSSPVGGAVRQKTPSPVGGAVRHPTPSRAVRSPTPVSTSPNSSIQHVSKQVRVTMEDYATKSPRFRGYTTDAIRSPPPPPPPGNPTIVTGPWSTATAAPSAARTTNPIANKVPPAVPTVAVTPPRSSGISSKLPSFRTAAAVMQQQENGGSARQPSLASAPSCAASKSPSPTTVAAPGLSKDIAAALMRSKSCLVTSTSTNESTFPLKKRKLYSVAASTPAAVFTSTGDRRERAVQKRSRRRSGGYSQASARTPSGQVDINFGTSVSQVPADQVACLSEATTFRWSGSQTPRVSPVPRDDYLLGLEEFLELNQQ